MRLKAQRTVKAPEQWDDWLTTLFPHLFYLPFVDRHVEFWQHIESIEPGVKPPAFFAIWGRGGGKSTNAEAAAVRLGATNKRKFCLYIRSTQDKANESVMNIAAMLESKQVTKYYPKLAERKLGKFGNSKGWKVNMLRCANGFNVAALGYDAAVRGIKLEEYRPDVIFIDDIDDKTDTLESIQKKISTLTRDILPSGSSDVAVIGIQNLVNYSGIFTQISKGQADFLRNRVVSGPYPAVIDLEYEMGQDNKWHITGGTPTWQGQDLATCEAQMNEWGLSSFISEAQLTITRKEGRVYHAFPGPGPDASALDLSKVSGFYHAHDFGAVNQVWGLFAKIEGRYYMIHEQKLPEGTTAARANIIKSHFANRKIVAGYGGAKSEDQQRRDYAKEGVTIRLPGITDVEGQINMANRMFERGELVICANCVYTVDMLENCIRDEKEGIQDKATWHYCFVAGTLISTIDGLKPIENIQTGDLVKTRNGYRSVTATGFRSEQEVITATFSSGIKLTGTPDHPIIINNSSTRLDALRYGDIISLDENFNKELYQWLIEKQLSLMVRGIINTPMLTTDLTGFILEREGSTCIGQSGNTITEESQIDSRCIIWTEIRPTTKYPIWQSSRSGSTLDNTTNQKVKSWKQYDKDSTKRLDLKLQSGTSQQRGELGTVFMQKTIIQKDNRSKETVQYVDSFSLQKISRSLQDSVQTIVNQLIGEDQVSTTKSEVVLDVDKAFQLINTARSNTVQVIALESPGFTQTVYNLTVEEDHEYYANGVLVANCDVIRYFAAGASRGVFVG